MPDVQEQPPQAPGAPVRSIPQDTTAAGPEAGRALCLSGGGYRAMLFHVGAVWRFYDSGQLPSLKRISSVSGGSITAGVLALKWNTLTTGGLNRVTFEKELVKPVRAMADETIDVDSAVLGFLLPGTVSDRIASAYDKYLFHGATLQDLPDDPRFVINATNVQTGALWRFMKPYMADYRVGIVKNPTVPLARAVTASSAFPPVLSPMDLPLEPTSVQSAPGADLHMKPYTSKAVLTDGGVYDNLGLETAWKRYDTILVSDGGAKMQAEEEPKTDALRHTYRVLSLIDNQVRSLRKRQLIDSYKANAQQAVFRKGAYWSIVADIADYGPNATLPCPHDRTLELSRIDTRLKRLDDLTQERLINWGYAVCDAALRKYVDPTIPAAQSFPYPASAV